MSAARTPCWCCGAAPDPDFQAQTCACSVLRCTRHRGETCVVCCDTLWREPEEPEAPDDEDPGRA